MENKLDTFFDHDRNVNRLIKEWKEHNGIIIAFDFDNTIYDYYNKGYVYDNAIELLKLCKKEGCILILYSCNNSSEKIDFMKEYLNSIDLEIDYVNKSPDNIPFGNEGSKIYFNILLDDRAGLFESYKILKDTYNEIKKG